MSTADNFKSRYHALFPDEKRKAEAFDKIARLYYQQNFATTPKAEIDLLMFSEYLDSIFAMEGVSESDYSDYTLSKELGITQARVRSFKERKELKYPSDYDWREAFWKAVEKLQYRDKSVRLYVRDLRLYTELNNLIQELGHYAEATLTRQLLVVSPAAFVELMVVAADLNESDKQAMREKLRDILAENAVDTDAYVAKEQTLAETTKHVTASVAKSVLLSALEFIPIVGPMTSRAVDRAIEEIKASN